MDERLQKAFAASAVSTFKEMFGIAAEAGPSRLLDPAESHGWDITGLIGLAGQAQGIVAIRLTRTLLLRLLAGSGVTVSGDEERKELEGGLVGELTNIIAGNATSALRDLNVEIAPPVVVRGLNHAIGWPTIAPVHVLAFKIPDGSFEIDLCIHV